MKALVTGSVLGLLVAAVPATVAAQDNEAAARPERTTATYGSWTVQCREGNSDADSVCEMVQVIRGPENQAVARVAIGQLPGSETPKVVLQLPVGVWLKANAQLDVDGDTMLEAEYFLCGRAACFADTETTAETLQTIGTGTDVVLEFLNARQQQVKLPLSLQGYPDAYAAAFRQ